MTVKQANNLKADIERSITEEDFTDDLYISIKGIGTKTFKGCTYHDTDGWIFIWTKDESFLLDKSELGDFVAIPLSENVNSL